MALGQHQLLSKFTLLERLNDIIAKTEPVDSEVPIAFYKEPAVDLYLALSLPLLPLLNAWMHVHPDLLLKLLLGKLAYFQKDLDF
jgi:hypothetical protein